MNTIAQVDPVEGQAVLDSLCPQHTELTLMVRRGHRWLQARANVAAATEDSFLLECTELPSDLSPVDLAPSTRIGAQFRHRGRLYLCACLVLGGEVLLGDEFREAPALAVTRPDMIFEISNRKHVRVMVPASEPVAASYWPLRCSGVPRIRGAGRAVNLSEGGAQLRIRPEEGPAVDICQEMGLRLFFERDERLIVFDARLCHAREDVADTALLGVSFLPSDNGSPTPSDWDFLRRKIQAWQLLQPADTQAV